MFVIDCSALKNQFILRPFFRLAQKKTEMLRSPKFHVSRTRLIIYNLPKSMSEEDVKKLCIDAVLFRASKQKPVIQMVCYNWIVKELFHSVYSMLLVS